MGTYELETPQRALPRTCRPDNSPCFSPEGMLLAGGGAVPLLLGLQSGLLVEVCYLPAGLSFHYGDGYR